MGKRMSVTTLPKDVLNKLRQRLLQSNFSNYQDHAAWLASMGFVNSKSAIHRYAMEYASSVMAEQGEGASLSVAEVRLRCLEAAAGLEQSSSSADLIEHADHLLKWVYTR